MLFIDSLRDLLRLDAPCSLCERQPLCREKQRPVKRGRFSAAELWV